MRGIFRRQGCVAAGVVLLGGVLGTTAGLGAQGKSAAEAESPLVLDVSFRGNKAFGSGDLQDAIATEPSRCKSLLVRVFCLFSKSSLWYDRKYLDRTELRRDPLRLRVFYWRRGYREAQVDTSVAKKGQGVAIAFRITEGRPTRVSSIVVRQPADTAVLSDREVRAQMQFRASDPFSILALDSSLVLLRGALFAKGYADALVKSDTVLVNDTSKTAAVRISIEPKWLARVGAIRVTGNQKLATGTVEDLLTLRPGSIYRRDEVFRSQQRLYESNLFRHAAIVIPPQGDSLKTIEVTVREAPLTESRTSAGFNTIEFLQAEQRITRYNFLGGARQLTLRGVVGNLLAPELNGMVPFRDVAVGLHGSDRTTYLRPNWQLSADLTQPSFRSPANSYGVSLFAHRRTIPAIVVDHGYGTSASFTRELADRTPLTVDYRYEITRVEAGDVYFCQYFGVCELAVIGALRGQQSLSPIALSLFSDRTNDLFFPTSGYLGRLDVEHASTYTASDFRYNRVSGELSKYFAVGHKSALAARVRAGWVRALASTGQSVGVGALAGGEIIHPRKRFYAGGAQSVRGYGENQLGPRVLTVDPGQLPVGALTVCQDVTSAGRQACSGLLARVASSQFDPRPTGGTALAEGNVELRFPVWGSLGGAVFVDGAFVGQGALQDVTKGTGAITPGFGGRYYSPAGAIRVDLGIRPTLTERLGVVTEVADSAGRSRIVQLSGTKLYNPLEGSHSFFRKVLDRLTLHLSIGQAF
jgi:outer membrane protein insertion porin family/translocation and assembly module TamA